jgi:hypothetical protein
VCYCQRRAATAARAHTCGAEFGVIVLAVGGVGAPVPITACEHVNVERLRHRAARALGLTASSVQLAAGGVVMVDGDVQPQAGTVLHALNTNAVRSGALVYAPRIAPSTGAGMTVRGVVGGPVGTIEVLNVAARSAGARADFAPRPAAATATAV